MSRDRFRPLPPVPYRDDAPYYPDSPYLIPDDAAPIVAAPRRPAPRRLPAAVAADPRAQEIADQLNDYQEALIDDENFVGPPDLRAPERRRADADAAWNANHWNSLTPEQQDEIRVSRMLSDSPTFTAGMSALNVPLLGLADEFAGAGLALGGDIPYRTAQRGMERAMAEGAEENPNAALFGGLAGMGLAAPLAPALAPEAGAVGLARFAPALRAGIPATALGGAAGYLGAPEGEEWQQALRGAATAGLYGLGGGAMTGLGRSLALAENYAPRLIGGALEGSGYGVLATPGASRTPIAEAGSEMGRETALNAGFGAGVGGPLGLLANPIALNRRRIAEAAAQGQRGGPNVAPSGAPVDFDEALLDVADIDAAPRVPGRELVEPGTGFGPSAAEIAGQVRAEQQMQPWYSRLIGDSFRADPNVQRLFSMGITDQRDIRRIVNSFGSPRAAVEALNEAGLAMPGSIYSTRDARGQALAVADAMQRDLSQVHQRVAAAGGEISGPAIADEIDRLADGYITGSEGPERRALVAALRARADDYRYGAGVRPQTRAEPLSVLEEMPTLGVDSELIPTFEEDIPVTALPPERNLSYANLRADMEAQAERNAGTYRGTRAVPPTASEEAGLDVYRALANARNSEIERVLGPEGYRDYLARNRAFRAAQSVSDARFETRGPADMRAAIGGMADIAAGGGIRDRLTGALRERAIAAYQPSIMATLNELGGAGPAQVMQGSARLMLESGAEFDDATRAALERAATSPGPDTLRVLEAAAQQAMNSPGATNAARAISLARGANDWPPIIRAIQQIARTDPARAERLAMLAENAAQRGSLAIVLPLIQRGPRVAEQVEANTTERMLNPPIQRSAESELAESPIYGPAEGGEVPDISDSPLFGDVPEDDEPIAGPPVRRPRP